ncbi:nuclear transport factor 2 family protein [Chelativorans xinjiangense]|uniref:nuclear transport factor 2 family protein n=1 Tax=Chelativorans xinjiangense TaxID=2681485 RepID=UPI001357DB73|nr:nuclear transport factor 2 family protein [Chelativorans xinjiangense]
MSELGLEQLEQWLAGYKHSWEKQDVDAFVSLYTDDAVYVDRPFSEPVQARDFHRFWTELATRQAQNHIEFEVLGVNGPVGIAHFRANYYRTTTGEHRTGDGIFVLSFDESGRCRVFREWQHWYPVDGKPAR